MRSGRAGLVGIAVLLAVGSGTGLLALSLSWRTDHAYADYLKRSRVADVVVNPSLITSRVDRVLRSTPGLISVRTDDLKNRVQRRLKRLRFAGLLRQASRALVEPFFEN